MTVDEIIRLMDHAKAIGCPHFKWDGVEFVIPRTKPQPVSKELPQRVPDEEVIP